MYTLTRTERVVRCFGWPIPILDDQITILAPDGSTRDVISLYDALEDIVPRSRVGRIYRAMLDPAAPQLSEWKTGARKFSPCG